MSEIYTSYKLNVNNAKQVGTPANIDEKGAFKGVFTRAELVKSKKGTQGIEFDFKSDDGATAKYLTVWTINGDGKELFGRKMIDAIMTCVGAKEVSATQANIKKWDAQTHAEITVNATVFQQLMNQPIGLVMAREEYQANDGAYKWKNMIVCPFEAKTNRIASERLDSKPAEMLDKIVKSLKDRPMARSARDNQMPPDDFGGFPSDYDPFN